MAVNFIICEKAGGLIRYRHMEKLFDSESCRHYISLLQENITRMASNCTSCKNWLITIVSALFALQLVSSDLKPYLWISIVPTVLFWLLDAYYLGQEKRFRNIESEFVKKLKSGEDIRDAIYSFTDGGKCPISYFLKGLKSESTWIMYSAMLLTIIMLVVFIN